MNSFTSRPHRMAGALSLALAATLSLPAQPTFTDWLGVDSNYLNPANWSGAAVPNGNSVIRMPSTPANKQINLAYTGMGTANYNVFGMQTGVRSGYTVSLSGTANGWVNFNLLGRGAGPDLPTINDVLTRATTGNAANRLPFFLNIGSYARVTANGSSGLFAAGQSGLGQANITMTGNAEMDLSQAGSVPYTYLPGSVNFVGTAAEIGGLQMVSGTTLFLGLKSMSLEGLNAVGETHVLAGRIYSDPTSTTRNVEKFGAGTTLMSGVVDWAGIWRIRSGRYVVDGVHNGRIEVAAANSVLGGNGTVNGAVTSVVNSVITPGSVGTAGTLTINGAVTHNGIMSFDLITATSFDRLAINGSLTIGATGGAAVGVAESFPLQPGTYRVLTVNTPITGVFNSVALPSSQGLAASYVLGANYLDVTFTQLAFATNPLLFGNHKTIATHVDAAVFAGSAPGTLLDTLNRQPSIILFREVLDQLSPSTYQSWFPSAVVRTNSLVQTLDDRLFQDARLGRNAGSLETFLQTYRQESSKDADQFAAYSNYDTTAVLGGFDYALGSQSVLGGFVSYETTDYDLDPTGGTSEVESLTAGIHARANRGPLQLNAVGFAGRDEYISKRTISRTNLGEWADSETEGSRYGANLTSLYLFQFSWLEVAPTVGLQYLSWDAKAFTETGSAGANLRVKYQSEASLASRVGVRFARSFEIKAGVIRPFLNLAWQHEFNDGERNLSAGLFGSTFTITAPGVKPDGYRVDAGIDWDVAKAVSLNLRYVAEYDGAADESIGIRGGLMIAF